MSLDRVRSRRLRRIYGSLLAIVVGLVALVSVPRTSSWSGTTSLTFPIFRGTGGETLVGFDPMVAGAREVAMVRIDIGHRQRLPWMRGFEWITVDTARVTVTPGPNPGWPGGGLSAPAATDAMRPRIAAAADHFSPNWQAGPLITGSGVRHTVQWRCIARSATALGGWGLVGTGLLRLVVLSSAEREFGRLLKGRCPRCQYDLTATEGLCPECGRGTSEEERVVLRSGLLFGTP